MKNLSVMLAEGSKVEEKEVNDKELTKEARRDLAKWMFMAVKDGDYDRFSELLFDYVELCKECVEEIEED